MKMITVANPKGGSGKTTTAVELSALLAQKGLNILLIDLNPQSEALSSCQNRPENLTVATDLGSVATLYDFVFVDTPTGQEKGTEQALILSDAVLVPVPFNMAATRVAKQFTEELSIPYWVIATQFRPRTRFGATYLEALRQQFGSQFLENPIHSSVKVAEAAAQGTPLSLLEDGGRALADYRNLTEFFLQNIAGQIVIRPKDLSTFHTPPPAVSAAQTEPQQLEEGVDLNEFDDMLKEI